jgi:hypothetical protein
MGEDGGGVRDQFDHDEEPSDGQVPVEPIKLQAVS